ncbi:hypothetical protein BZM26_22095 [Paraburkholderia strydomiana]|nr:hypothetical protein BZM26_22095 [Paraburkholderia strydomiana]
MRGTAGSRVIYGDAPFIEDMGLLTVLCLLNDEVLLFGKTGLDKQLDDYRAKHAEQGSAEDSIVVQTFKSLLPEGVVSFLSPFDFNSRFPGAGNFELSGIEGLEKLEVDGKTVVNVKINHSELDDLSRTLLRGISVGARTASSMQRDVAILSVAAHAEMPIVCTSAQISLSPSSTRVSEVAAFLERRTFERLALPELRAYHVDDILEARLKLSGELQEFRAGIRELVWLLHQRIDISGNLRGLATECDVLIDTKIWAAVSMLEKAIVTHQSKRIRRILKTTAGVFLEVGKSLISPTIATTLLGGSAALLKVADGLEASPPTLQIASLIYKVREKDF